MSHEEDHCFQCQESGHMAWYCPNVQCFESDEYRYILLLIATDNILNIDIQIGQPHATIMRTSTNAIDPDHIHINKDITATVTIIPTEAILGHTIGTNDNITEAIHDTHTQKTILTMTLHIEDHLHLGAHQFTHEIAADHTFD